MRKFVIKFMGVDDFNRPVFKVVDKAIYFGSTNILVPDKDRFPKGTKEEIYGFGLDAGGAYEAETWE